MRVQRAWSMSSGIACAAAVLAGWLIVIGATECRAGDLDPPAGPVAETGKRLRELEPRTALTIENTPGSVDARYIITASGSYYLTSNASLAGQPLILVQPTARDVTIDLMGFQVTMNVLASLLETDPAFIGTITLRNGSVHGFTTSSGRTIILGNTAAAVTCEDLRIEDARDGLTLGDNAVVRRCLLRTCANLQDAAAISAGSGSLVESCTVRDVTHSGSGACIRVGANSMVRQNTITQIGSVATGIDVGSGCIVEGNIVRCDTNAVAFTAIRTNATAVVRGNSVTATAALTVTGVSGASSSTVCDNFFSSCDTGVSLATGTECVVVRNHFRNSTTDVQATFPASNIIGPTIGPGGAAASNNPHANYSN